MVKSLKTFFCLNAGLFALYVSLANCCFMLENMHWQLNYSILENLKIAAIFLVVIFLFVQMNMKLFPSGLELDFWKEFSLRYLGLKRCFFSLVVVYQILLLWWTPGLLRIPSLIGEIVAYSLMTAGDVEDSERVYAATHKNENSSFAAISTYALMNRGLRKADDTRIDDAIRNVYGERSPQMQERKRLLADFILMTKGEVTRVEELRKEARAIDLEKCTWETNHLYCVGEKPYFFDQEKYPFIMKAFKVKPNPPKIEVTPELLRKLPTGALIGAPEDPRYGQIMIKVPQIYCFPYPKESDGRANSARLSYRAKFRDFLEKKSKSAEIMAALTLLFVPASFITTIALSFGRRRLFERLSKQWKTESLTAKNWSQRFSAVNSLIILERLQGNLEEANQASLRMLEMAERAELQTNKCV